jgi:class 3 adenylate cyclase/tetratricopeptide (TPR) repeat protein
MTSLPLNISGIMGGPRSHSTRWRDLVRSSGARFETGGLRPRAREASVSDSESPGEETGLARPMVWAKRAVLLIDVVESVRLIEQDETGAVSRWLGFVEHVRNRILPDMSGRIVKSLGDGLLIDFADVRAAVAAAFAIQQASNRGNAGVPPERQMHLRMGLEVSDVIVEADDVHGRGVNLAARLLTLAGPGEIIISAHARDQLTADLDAEIEDLGDCFVRHLSEPVRAYRVGPTGPKPILRSVMPHEELAPAIAVVPFAARQASAEHDIVGEVLAEEIIRALSHAPDLSVISRLSTTVFRGRAVTLSEISSHLNAEYVLSGVYSVDGDQVTLDTELAEVKSGRIVWTDRIKDRVAGILRGERELIGRVVSEVSTAIVTRELQRAQSQPLPTLKAYTLLLGAIALMHRLALRDFEQAYQLLQTLIERGGRHPIPHAWLAHWHVLRAQQGWSSDPRQDAVRALEGTKRALDADPDCSHALAVDGLVHTHFLKRFDIAEERYDQAIKTNPSNALAWLLRGTQYAFMGEGQRAVDDTQRALTLSPLDPHRYYYDSLAASAHLAARQYTQALESTQRSLRANRKHTSTLRVMAVAQWQLGRHEEARKTAQELLTLEPGLTVSRWLERSPSAPYPVGQEIARILRQAGVPN